jgi:hypothetical protein
VSCHCRSHRPDRVCGDYGPRGERGRQVALRLRGRSARAFSTGPSDRTSSTRSRFAEATSKRSTSTLRRNATGLVSTSTRSGSSARRASRMVSPGATRTAPGVDP